MPATSSYTQLGNAIWNAIRTSADLFSFRLALNPRGGRDFDGSGSYEAFPTELPTLDESPAIAIVLGSAPAISPIGSRQWDESVALKVYLWINTRQPDDFNRFVELTKQAILTRAEWLFNDQTSPSLSFPTLLEVPEMQDGEVQDPTELGNNWWRASLIVRVKFHTQVE